MNLRDDGDSVTIDILVQPRASRIRIGPLHGDRLKVAVTSPPVDGAANAAVVALFAKALRLPKSAIEVVHGATSKRKTLRLIGTTRAAIEAVIS